MAHPEPDSPLNCDSGNSPINLMKNWIKKKGKKKREEKEDRTKNVGAKQIPGISTYLEALTYH